MGLYFRISFLLLLVSISGYAQGKNPMILIPGLSGSELRHRDTNERIWFRALKPKSEDMRLPILADFRASNDELVPGDVLREVKVGVFPVVDVYGGFIKAMQLRGGYHEEKWESPSEDGDRDSLYVFAYDWRLDNVDNARLLIRKVEALRQRLKKPDLKFDIVAHSMGGIISRYAVMYGDQDLPEAGTAPKPTWAGDKLFDRVILMGTPNEGSALALSSLVNGFTIGGLRIDLPFLQDTSKFTIFTVPSAYQLLPAPGTFLAYDERQKPLSIDIYDPKTWSEYGWNPIEDPGFAEEFKLVSAKDAGQFFAGNLDRARRLHEALAAANGNSGNVEFHALGSDCRNALNAVTLYRDAKTKRWKTLFDAKEFLGSDGRKISADALRKLLFTSGDGVVSDRSLRAVRNTGGQNSGSIFGGRSEKFICGDHNRLAANVKVQEYIISLLNKPRAEKH